MADIVICDFAAGRVGQGHTTDYLSALEAALAKRQPRVVAPFLEGGVSSSVPGARGGQYRKRVQVLWRLLNHTSDGPLIVLFPSPESSDFLVYASAAKYRRPHGHVAAVFVVRRERWGAPTGVGQLKSKLVAAAQRWLVREGLAVLVSDSEVVARYVTELTGQPCPVVAIPAYPASASRHRTGPITFGLIGGFRLERGAHAYERVVALCQRSFPDARLVIQIPAGAKGEEATLVVALRRRAEGVEGVHLIDGRLSAEDFAALLASLDVVVLPYDVLSYGGGTSGVMHEALRNGKVVVTTHIAWAAAKFDVHPNVVWLDDLDEESLGRGLAIAHDRAREARRGGGAAPMLADTFAEDWEAAVQFALARIHAAPLSSVL